MEVAIGHGRNSFNMEKGMAWRDLEDEGFKSSTNSLPMIYIKYTIPYHTIQYRQLRRLVEVHFAEMTGDRY